MFKSFKLQVVLPVVTIALVLILGGAIGFSLWATKHEEALVQQEVNDKVSSVQSIFVTTSKLMDDRVHASMSLFEEQVNSRGGAERGPTVAVHGNSAPDILLGGKAQGNNFDVVDYVTRFEGGTATLFSKDGTRFVRISTNVKKPDGSRAVGTELNTTTRAYDANIHGQAFFGVVDILGSAYFTGYEPLLSKAAGEVIGILYVGYKAELPVLNSALDNSRLLENGFVAVIDDQSGVRYQPSWMTPQAAQERIANADGSWNVNRVPLPEWGLTIVSAYPRAELEGLSRRIGYGVALAGLVIGIVISLVLFVLLDRQVLHLLGGEPRLAATYMKRIADGDLAVNIGVANNDNASLMASLKVMQLKLKNLVAAVHGGAAEVSEQARKFEIAFGAFQRTRDESAAQELLRQTRAVGGTLAVLEKSIGRFKV
jgi:methyl-accepting chemotaxis protein